MFVIAVTYFFLIKFEICLIEASCQIFFCELSIIKS